MNLDTRIFYDINDFARTTPWLHPIVSGYAAYGVVLFAALLLAGWWSARRDGDTARMAAAMWAPLGMLVALVINQPIAAAVDETRPCTALHDIVVLHCNTDPGFPSDHAVMVGAVTAGLWLVHRRLAALAAVAAVVMAFARVYIAAHYPQDVLAGLALGAVVSLAGYVLARPLLRWLLALAAGTPLRILVTASPAKPVAAR
ncbi:phosphatase PAP2 family protein [Nocardia macrotermitis]|uniref:Undecaprenyl-diphosphatase BcrC n=1 Tax=Nocardia macrotermitis TaxID=2585198 RepID=A0A7K0DHU2_9NOCA|nr:phosphatase PAP2 family protein [Nocardia macrotermitis]MQY24364.1 Undecaprenyl-diphosphatase BcrC [Nocardia macrotermitis]